jgi:hypothetical protein
VQIDDPLIAKQRTDSRLVRRVFEGH